MLYKNLGKINFSSSSTRCTFVLQKDAEQALKRFVMGYEFINNVPRWCLWLVGISPKELRSMPLVMERVEKVKALRQKSSQVKLADRPHLFRESRNPEHYLAFPNTSSENRQYVPVGWLDASVIPGNEIRILPDATLYHFGVLTSRVHMAWMKAVGGRLKSDYRYSKDIVYNNFVWPSVNEKQKSKIESAAKKILEAREKFPDSSLADLYDPLTMPEELLKAHKANDAEVCEAYGFDKEIKEEEIVSALMSLYEKISK